jgi:hypothetical protein
VREQGRCVCAASRSGSRGERIIANADADSTYPPSGSTPHQTLVNEQIASHIRHVLFTEAPGASRWQLVSRAGVAAGGTPRRPPRESTNVLGFNFAFAGLTHSSVASGSDAGHGVFKNQLGGPWQKMADSPIACRRWGDFTAVSPAPAPATSAAAGLLQHRGSARLLYEPSR